MQEHDGLARPRLDVGHLMAQDRREPLACSPLCGGTGHLTPLPLLSPAMVTPPACMASRSHAQRHHRSGPGPQRPVTPRRSISPQRYAAEQAATMRVR